MLEQSSPEVRARKKLSPGWPDPAWLAKWRFSANPDLQVKFRATGSGPVMPTSIDDNGEKIAGAEKSPVA